MTTMVCKKMFIIFATFFAQISFSQVSCNPFPKGDVEKLNDRVFNMYAKASANPKDKVHIVNVFDAYCPSFEKKEMFQDTSFLNYIELDNIKIRRKKYLASHSIICNEQDSVVGHCWYYSYGNNPGQYVQSFIDTISSYKINQIYKFRNGVHNSFYVAVDMDCNVYLLDSREYGFRVYPISKCTDFQWKCVTKGHKRLNINSSLLHSKIDMGK